MLRRAQLRLQRLQQWRHGHHLREWRRRNWAKDSKRSNRHVRLRRNPCLDPLEFRLLAEQTEVWQRHFRRQCAHARADRWRSISRRRRRCRLGERKLRARIQATYQRQCASGTTEKGFQV
jgi:hypothetical protein